MTTRPARLSLPHPWVALTVTRCVLITALPALVLIACCSTGAPATSWPDPEGLSAQRALIEKTFAGTDVRSDALALADFRSGLRNSVSAAWWGYDENDATSSLQASLDSGARVVLVPAMGTPWITKPLFVRSHTTIILQEGVEIVAKKGSFRGQDNSLLSLKDVEDVTLSGYGARLSMRKNDYRSPPYEHSEWRHAVELNGCARVRLQGLRIESSGGDGVYLGAGERTFNERITLQDLKLRDHYRQGISVISAQDLLIENVEMSFTEGTPPSAGIDFEPNYEKERIVGCVLKNCTIRSNAGPGILVNLRMLSRTSREIDIRVEDSFIANPPFALAVFGAGRAAGRIELRNTRLCGLQLVAPGSRVTVVRD